MTVVLSLILDRKKLTSAACFTNLGSWVMNCVGTVVVVRMRIFKAKQKHLRRRMDTSLKLKGHVYCAQCVQFCCTSVRHGVCLWAVFVGWIFSIPDVYLVSPGFDEVLGRLIQRLGS